jgi:short-subunit dehydrogenase
MAIPLDSAYHGTKFALEGLSESLQYFTSLFSKKLLLSQEQEENMSSTTLIA